MTKFKDWVPYDVIPAVLLPFHDDFTIDEKSYCKHLRDVVAVDGISAITVNGHSSEINACTVDEQPRQQLPAMWIRRWSLPEREST